MDPNNGATVDGPQALRSTVADITAECSQCAPLTPRLFQLQR